MVPPGPIRELRERWGIGAEKQIVLHAARLTSLKGHRQVIEAASCLYREGALENAVIIFAGDMAGKDTYRRELIHLIRQHGLDDKVRLVGHCSDMPAAFLAAHVALVPSVVAETFGRTSIEAQAMGCPVIVSNLGALPETVISPDQSTTHFTGWLVPPGVVTKLRDALLLALGLSTNERRQIGARARAHVHARFSLEQMQAKTLAVYDELLETDLAKQFANPFE